MLHGQLDYEKKNNFFHFNLATGRLLYKYVVKREKVLNIGYASALFQRGI